jgi:proton-translocating NADH-quinone oxidoreductase chain N
VTGSVWVILPLACLGGGAVVVALVGRLLARLSPRLAPARNGLLALLTALVFGASLLASLPLLALASREAFVGLEWGSQGPGSASLRADPGALIVIVVALALGLIVAVYSGRYLALDRRYDAYYPLLLLLVAGLAGMVLAADLFNLYMFCELMSVAAYALVAFRRRTDTAIEAGFKYLIMGSVSSAILLMGITFVYRSTGSLALPEVRAARGPSLVMASVWGRAGLACLLVGLAVKSAFVPLHTWLPDAHGRAPSSVSALLSGIIVQSAFYALLKASLSLGLPARSLGTGLILLSLLDMTLGNVLALAQTHTKRLLAYSTIAQTGYMMFGVGVGLRYDLPAAVQAGFFLLVAHAAMKGLAFLCKGVCHFYCDSFTIGQLRGTARDLPLVAVAFSVALGGLAGVPPLAGFAGKWFIAAQVVRPADALVYAGLAIVVLNGLLSLGYYLPLIGTLYTLPAEGQGSGGRVHISAWMAVPLAALGGLVLAIGFCPGPWLGWLAHVGPYLLMLGDQVPPR